MHITTPIQIKEIPPKGHHIFVKGRIGRIPVNFLIDTGASKSVVDAKFAEDHFKMGKVIKTDHLTTGLGANIPNSSFLKLRRIKIGKTKIKPTTFALLDLSVVNDAYASANLEPVIAIIGGDILMKYKSNIDYQTKALTLRK